mgnify:CR=1 FL=1
MKKILTIFALVMGFVSCQKAAETTVPEVNDSQAGMLCVTGHISNVTKTQFTCTDEHVLTPQWKVGDQIIGLWGTNNAVTWSVKEVSEGGGAVFQFDSGIEPLEDGTEVSVIYAPGKRVSDIEGTGDGRTLGYDLSNQDGTLASLGNYSLMTGKGTVAGTDLELTFNHAIAVVSLDILKGLAPSTGGYSVSIENDGLPNCGTFGFGSDGAVTFTGGQAGKISTGDTFSSDENGEFGPVFFAVPATSLTGLTVSVTKGTDIVNYNLSDKEMTAGHYYYMTLLQPIRVLTLSFSNVSGLTMPDFEDGKSVKVSDGTASENCTVKVFGSIAKIQTTLKGQLTAVYPSEAAIMNGNSISRVKVPAVQTGKLEDAVFGLADVASDATQAEFSTKAIFEITPPSGVKTFTITSLQTVSSDARTGTAEDINTEGTDKKIITVGDGDEELGTVYVSLVPGVKLTDLSFDAGESSGMKGIPGEVITTAANTKYTIDNNGWHPYVTIGGKKWAAENFGATDNDRFGDYYSGFNWGGSWRIPTTGEDNSKDFFQLVSVCRNDDNINLQASTTRLKLIEVSEEPGSQGIYYYNVTDSEAVIFVDENNNRLSFPCKKDRWNIYYTSSAKTEDSLYSVFFGNGDTADGSTEENPVHVVNLMNYGGQQYLRPVSD